MSLLRDELPAALREPVQMTEAEFLELPEHIKAEWVDGVTYFDMSPVSLQHDKVRTWFHTVLHLLGEERGLGQAFGEKVTVRFPHLRRMREPDVTFVCSGNPAVMERNRIVGVPDLVVEVVSVDSVERDHVTKLAEYEQAGIREYWIVDPLQQKVGLYRLVGTDFVDVAPDPSGRLCSEVVEGFFFSPEWLRGPLPSAYQIVKQMGL